MHCILNLKAISFICHKFSPFSSSVVVYLACNLDSSYPGLSFFCVH